MKAHYQRLLATSIGRRIKMMLSIAYTQVLRTWPTLVSFGVAGSMLAIYLGRYWANLGCVGLTHY